MTALTGSIVLPDWRCPSCGTLNANTTAQCGNKRYDEASPRYLAIPPVPTGYGLHNIGEYFDFLGLGDVPPPAIVWECPGVRACPVGACGEPARAYGHGPRCETHSDVMAVMT